MRLSLLALALACAVTEPARAQAATSSACNALAAPAPQTDSIARFIWSLPRARCLAYLHAAPRDTERTTQGMVEAIDQVTNEIRPLLDSLARFYPAGQFGANAHVFIDSVIRFDGRWLDLVNQPGGVGLSGTMSRIALALAVRERVEGLIEEMVAGLEGSDGDFAWDAWRRAWHRSWGGT